MFAWDVAYLASYDIKDSEKNESPLAARTLGLASATTWTLLFVNAPDGLIEPPTFRSVGTGAPRDQARYEFGSHVEIPSHTTGRNGTRHTVCTATCPTDCSPGSATATITMCL
jgi:hypothetical protein